MLTGQLQGIAFTLKNSTTILLPAWEKTLSTHGLPTHMMPYDVSTCWNSTFDIVEFAIQYRVTIDTMTTVHGFDLRKYELVPDEWKIAIELQDVLRVSTCFPPFFLLIHVISSRSSRMRLCTFLVAPQTWQPSSLQWTSLTSPLTRRSIHHKSTLLPSVLRSPLGKGLCPSITTKLGSRKYIVLR